MGKYGNGGSQLHEYLPCFSETERNSTQFLSPMDYPKLAREMIAHSHRASPIIKLSVFLYSSAVGTFFNNNSYLIFKSWRFGTVPLAPREVIVRPTLGSVNGTAGTVFLQSST